MSQEIRKANIGLIGLAVMGANLARNLESRQFTVAVANRTPQRTRDFIQEYGHNHHFIGCETVAELADSLQKPRVVLLMVKAGQPVDDLIGELVPHLEPDDVIIDGGNSYFEDTERRQKTLAESGILFVGCGISGGELGALNGPALMPGGNPAAWPVVRPYLDAIAARADDGSACCEWIGDGGAGHYVKMVHNGIEYGDMQLISECCALLHQAGRMEYDAIAECFRRWNQGVLNSYLIEITAKILTTVDPETGEYVPHLIRDTAGQKGTGKWSVESALALNVATPVMADAVFARVLSSDTESRRRLAKLYPEKNRPGLTEESAIFAERVRQALFNAKICSYAQGFQLIRHAGREYGWKLDFAAIASVWRNGCIIRAGFLDDIRRAYLENAELDNLLESNFFRHALIAGEAAWREAATVAVANGIPCPGLLGALAWFDTVRCERLPAYLIQAQRDYFGAHTYERTDRPRGKFFHTDWNGDLFSREAGK